MKNPQEILEGLSQFGGATVWYKPLLYPLYLYTKGVRYLAIHTDCFWFLDFIFSNQLLPAIASEEFQVWTIVTDGNKAIITVGDGNDNDNKIETFTLPYTSFLLKEYTLWFIQGRLMLKTEY